MQRICYIVLLLCCISCSTYKKSNAPKKEFRGVWIATVVNIDWPKNANDDSAKQKKDFLKILDFYQKLNFNAAIVQIRTAGDAFYKTNLAPWSKYLTGKEGEAPKDFNEPLNWMIAETHKRGMEFHAWLNPYRATFNLDTLSLSKEHDFYKHPDWMLKYGKKYYYNPGLPEVQHKLTNIITEIVTDYPVDAIHFDDYFYPYKIKDEVFNDSITFKTYGLQNQRLDDWRRSNVDSLVKKVHRSIRKNKPWVQFGISPFGVWKNKSTDPKGSDTKAGQTTYEDLYADPLLWIEKGWIDYLVPQAYWSMDYDPASHRTIATWWANTIENTNLYMGNGPYKIKNNTDKAWNKKKEIPKQIAFAREEPNITGNVFFSAKSLLGQNENVTKILKRKFYRFPAQNPDGLVKSKRNVPKPKIESIQVNETNIRINTVHKDSIPRFLQFYLKLDSNEKLLIKKSYLSENENLNTTQIQLPKSQLKNMMVVSVIDAYGNESELQPLKLKSD
ncbi:N-acetylmuramoyl-L-alanine amidase [Flagellimonas maritima]|uniref:N-acetylmuramoyl-L-alanine amidase n=1 Tax=Flagellimonas maritima TaxID=1383885 RepID=A0A2Z4LPX3_9FLAO|nr:family 10 glycosylhydrolase [Allomuricauda aurantiaca]AWX43297.1 N-acetylmuramoyl-L-alanine amidase [Allomuricauda aurantiaca]